MLTKWMGIPKKIVNEGIRKKNLIYTLEKEQNCFVVIQN